MKRWTRWQDWVAVAAGLYAALASIWTIPRTGATISLLIVLGVLMTAAGVWSLAAPGLVSMTWILAVRLRRRPGPRLDLMGLRWPRHHHGPLGHRTGREGAPHDPWWRAGCPRVRHTG